MMVFASANAALFPGFGGGGGSAQVPEIPVPPSPFASDAARDTYYATNFAELRNDPDSVYTVVEVTGGSTFRWSGDDTPSSYSADQWQVLAAENSPEMIKTLYESNDNTNAFTDADDGAVTSIMGLSSGTIPMSDGSALTNSGMTVGVVNGLSRVTIDGELAPRSGGGLRLGQNDIGGGGNIYGGGSALRYSNTVNDTESYPVTSLVTNAGSGDAFYPKFDVLRNDPSPSDKSETFTGNPGHRFAFNNPLPGRVTEYTISNPSATTFTGCNFTIWENGYDDPNPLFDFVDSNPAPVKTFDFPPGDVTVTPPEPIGFPPTGTRIFSEIICDSANIQLAGQTIPFPLDPLNPGAGTENVEFPYIEFMRNFSTQQFIEDSLGNPTSDGQVLTSTIAGVRTWIPPAAVADHPVTLRRDMPTEVDAQALADASLNQNSALWITANDQLTTSNRADALIRAQRAGFLDLDGNEIPITDVAANTIQLRTGTVVRIFGGNEYRVVNSPVFEGDIPEPLPPIEINAQEFFITASNYTDYLDRTIRLTNSNAAVVQVIRFNSIATFLAANPGRDVSFSFIVNRGASSRAVDFIASGSETIGGSNSQRRLEDQTITITLPSSGTNWLVTSNSRTVAASEVIVDRALLSTVQGTTAQDTAQELERLFGIVAAIQLPGTPSTRPLNTFSGDLTIVAGNLASHINRNNIYTGTGDDDVILPTEAVLAGNYPAVFEFQNFGTGELRIRRNGEYDANDLSTYLRRGSDTGSNLQFVILQPGETTVITKLTVDSPSVSIESSADPRSSILPNGIFALHPTRDVAPILNVNGDYVLFGLSGFTPTMGDAFEVTRDGITEESTFGRLVQSGDVLVAKVDGPSLLMDENNDDWLIIRDAGHGELTLTELRFLAQITESDSFTDMRLMDRSDVNDARVFLATGTLDHAPFITPSTDPNNPQTDGTTYLGGDELDGASFEFEHNSNLPSNQVYVDIDGSFSTDELANTFLVYKDRDGVEVERHSLLDDFRPVVLTGSGDTYYVLDTVGAVDNFSTINYINGYTIDLVFRTTNRQFNFNSSINVLSAIPRDSITIDKLEPNAQALLQADHDLSDAEQAKLDGLLTSGTATTWTRGELLVKLGADLPSNDLASYHDVDQLNGIVSNYDRTTPVTFLVPNFITVTQLQKVETPATKTPVTPIGTILGRQAFTANLPASSFDINNPIPDLWQVDGTASNLFLSGAVDTFDIHRGNLDDNLDHAIFDEVPATALPEILTQLANDLTRTVTTTSGWRGLSPSTEFGLDREAAKLWDENLRNDTGNYFDDLTDIEFIGFQSNNVFFYSDPDATFNTAFPGFQSYILNAPMRVRNTGSGTNIGDGGNKIIMFDYSLQRTLDDSTDLPMIRVGPSASTPLVGLDGQSGLHLKIGRQDGGTRSRTYDEQLSVVGGHWHDQIDETTDAEAEVVLPQSRTGSFTVRIDIQLDNNGNDEGTHSETITITNLDADQSFGNRDFIFNGVDGGTAIDDRTVGITYEHDNNDLSSSRRVIFLRPTQPFTNAALTYNVSAFDQITESWTAPATYAEYPINSGDPHDRFGVFDPALWTTERLRTPEHVAIMLRPYRMGDQSADPEMAVYAVVNGEHEGDTRSERLIRLHRPLSDFTTDDVLIGNNNVGVSHFQMYSYDVTRAPSEAEFYQLTTNENTWIGAFTDADEATDTFNFAGLATFTGVIGGKDVRATMIEDAGATDGYRWEFTEL